MEPEKPEPEKAVKDTSAEKALEKPLETVVDSKGVEKTVEKQDKHKGKEGEKIGVKDPIVIAFINGKSGGQQGENVKKQLRQYLPPEQVYDLSEGGPAPGLTPWQEHAADLVVIACGGDGTVGWVLSTLDKLGWKVWPCVAVLPLGTGNDMSRVLKWGKGYQGQSLQPFLTNVTQSKVKIDFDRWMVQINTLSKEQVEEYRKKYIKEDKEKKGGEKDKAGTPNRTSLEHPNNTSNNNTNVAESTAQPTTEPNVTNAATATNATEALSDSKKQPTTAQPQSGATYQNGTSDELHVLGETPKTGSTNTNDTTAPTALSESTSGNKTAEKEGGEKEKDKQFNWVMNNYFSIGIDSQVCLDFHNMREEHPGLFKSKFVNFGWYGMLSMKRATTEWQNIAKIAYLEVDDVPIQISSKYMAIVILNIPSYAGGTDLWGTGHNHGAQTVCDGKFEVVGVRGISHMGLMQSKMSSGGEHITQGKKVKLILLSEMAIQIDGEAWMKQPSEITIYHQNQAKLLLNQKKDKKSRIEQRLTTGS